MNKNDLFIKLDEWIIEQQYQEYSSNTLSQYKANVLKFINWIPDDTKTITKQTTMAKELSHQVNLALRELNAARRGFDIFIYRKDIYFLFFYPS